MHLGFIVALVVAVPVIFFPAAFIWYLHTSGIYALIKHDQKVKVVTETVPRDDRRHYNPPTAHRNLRFFLALGHLGRGVSR
jgi:hypothetical protein